MGSDFKSVIADTKKLWRKHHLSYDQARYVAKEVRYALSIERPKTRKRVVARLSQEEERRLIAHAYRMKGVRYSRLPAHIILFSSAVNTSLHPY